MEIAEKLRFTRDLITAHIINAYSPEELIAMELFRAGITEADYFNMRKGLNTDEPTVIRIANYLRDTWRTRNEH
jgi:hypothetical protein